MAIRNPFDQIVSNFFFIKKNPTEFSHLKNINFKEYIKRYAQKFFQRNIDIFVIDGKIIADTVLKYENLYENLYIIINKINLPKSIKNDYKLIKTKKNNYFKSERNEILTKENVLILKNKISDVYKQFYSF